MDAATKQRVKQAVLDRAREDLAATRADIGDERTATTLDQDLPHAPDDLAQADEAGDLRGLLERSAERQEAVLRQIEQLDVGPTDEIRPGALVELDGQRYLVGVVSSAVEVDGVPYEGLSADAPLLAAMSGLHAGDSFTVNGREHHIGAVG
jgi:transcription elongation GreA/GreB family factor